MLERSKVTVAVIVSINLQPNRIWTWSINLRYEFNTIGFFVNTIMIAIIFFLLQVRNKKERVKKNKINLHHRWRINAVIPSSNDYYNTSRTARHEIAKWLACHVMGVTWHHGYFCCQHFLSNKYHQSFQFLQIETVSWSILYQYFDAWLIWYTFFVVFYSITFSK